MPRNPRIEYGGAVYHVMSRGNRQEEIFRDDTDRELFLQTLTEVCAKTGWVIHAYVLMDNHYHILLETPEPNLVFGMKWFQGTYTQRFNARNRVLESLPRGAPEKKALVWYILSKTTVSNDWLSQYLFCGHPSNIPLCINAVKDKKSKVLNRLVAKLLKCEG